MKSLLSHSVLFSVRGRKHTRKPVSPFQDYTSSTNSNKARDFPGGPGVKNLPCNAGDTGSIPGWETKSPYSTTRESMSLKLKSLQDAKKIPHAAAMKTQCSQRNKLILKKKITTAS